MGAVPNLAARVQEVAEVNTVCITEATKELAQGAFELSNVGVVELRGIGEPLGLFRVEGISGAVGRKKEATRRQATLIGRRDEIARLQAAWGYAKRGNLVCAVLTGEAGIGKSRLVDHLRQQVRHEASLVFEIHGDAFLLKSPLAAIRKAMIGAVGCNGAHALDTLKMIGMEEVEIGLVQALAGEMPSDSWNESVRAWTPQRLRRETTSAMRSFFSRYAKTGPILLVVEDLHWVDPSTMELIQEIASGCSSVAMLVVATTRIESQSLGVAPTHVRLDRLQAGEARELVRAIFDKLPIAADVYSYIVERSQGVPMFVEELSRAVERLDLLKRGAAGEYTLAKEPSLPETVLGNLRSRIDSAGNAKRALQLASLIGSTVDLGILNAASELSGVDARTSVQHLVDVGILYIQDECTVGFAHILLREAAELSLVTSSRRILEKSIAQALRSGFSEITNAQPERVAHHLTHAGETSEAINWWIRAGGSAIQRSANREAVEHLRTAIGLVGNLPDGSERLQTELVLRSMLGVPLTLLNGWAHPDVGATFERAQTLCAIVGETPHLMGARIGLGTYFIVRGQFRRAQQMAYQSLSIAQQSQDVGHTLEAHYDCGATSMYLAEFDRALKHLDCVEQMYVPERDHAHAWSYGKDPLTVTLVHKAMVLASTGRVDSALGCAKRAVSHSEQWNHPFSHAWALIGVAITHIIRGEPEDAAKVGEEIVEMASLQGFPNWLAQGEMYAGLGEVLTSGGQVGVERIRRALDLWRRTGAELGIPMLSSLLVRALLAVGRVDEARTELSWAIETQNRTEELWASSELMRLRGDVALVIDGPDAALACYEAAVGIAKKSGAKYFGLAASASAGMVLRQSGDMARAREFLGQALSSVVEGRSCPHVVRAQKELDLCRV